MWKRKKKMANDGVYQVPLEKKIEIIKNQITALQEDKRRCHYAVTTGIIRHALWELEDKLQRLEEEQENGSTKEN
jgi:hypothetical protein